MTHHPIYETYLNEMKRLGATPPYMSEAQVLESAGIVIEEKRYILHSYLVKKRVSEMWSRRYQIMLYEKLSEASPVISISVGKEMERGSSRREPQTQTRGSVETQSAEEEIKRSDFVSADDYYDALEAQKMVSIMRDVM
jgi:hypothetical protein